MFSPWSQKKDAAARPDSSRLNEVGYAAQYLGAAGSPDRIAADELMNCLLSDAIRLHASDIHIEPWETSIVVRMRIQGSLVRIVDIPLEVHDRLIGRLKVMADLARFEVSKPQEGHAPVDFDHGMVQLRVSLFPVKRGEKAAIRLFNKHDRSFKLEDLGLEEESHYKLARLLSAPFGTILFSGPTGSGKTTLMYSALCYLSRIYGDTVSIATVEDPVEFNLPSISQGEINPANEVTYPTALRSLMRQDPQVILIGEIRDAETASIALQAGLTGHLVLSSIHSPNSSGVFTRLTHMGMEPFVLASSILGVVAMRLLPQNCPNCLEPYTPEPALLHLLAPAQRDEAIFRRGGGCAHCQGTGVSRRRPVTEILEVKESVCDAIMARAPSAAIQRAAQGCGMETLWQAGIRQVMNGETRMDLLLRSIVPDALGPAQNEQAP